MVINQIYLIDKNIWKYLFDQDHRKWDNPVSVST